MRFNVTIETGPTPEYDTMDEPTVVRLIRQAYAQGFTISAEANSYTITLANGQRTIRILPGRRPQLPTDRQRDELHRMIVLGRELTWERSRRNVGVLTDGALKMSHQLSDGLLERGYVTGTGHPGTEARRTLVACLAYARSAKTKPREARDEILRRALLDLAQTDTVAWRETADPADGAPEPEPKQQAAEKTTVQKSAPTSTTPHIVEELNRQGVATNTAAGALFTDMMTLFNKYERETAATRAAQGDTNPYDLDEWEPLEALADEWTSTEGNKQAREQFLDRLADQLTLDNLRVLRVLAEAGAAVTPRVVRAERARYKVPEIARRSGLTESRVYQILRNN
ncbi:hypothetical protein HHL19_12885 [Streptomyces sp. R302]|uniref:hypothetical protein n=1 Tax=unclassified Streptomyces TaxID=2593676 RepID=UPI00145E1B6E|nr:MULTISPECIES: hypothetical protein [unclassified Streptomyces]NML50556.1 hypothetical protein [Streptomyces sp. R301]NML79547.1 hypothetical protein [Streptomyces sp. R302]